MFWGNNEGVNSNSSFNHLSLLPRECPVGQGGVSWEGGMQGGAAVSPWESAP